jgi:hypothetical protein
VGSGRQLNPYQAVTPAQAAVLRPRYRLTLVKHVRGLTVFLLTRVPKALHPATSYRAIAYRGNEPAASGRNATIRR